MKEGLAVFLALRGLIGFPRTLFLAAVPTPPVFLLAAGSRRASVDVDPFHAG